VNPAFWSGKRVLITGHTGFKGAWLAIWLRRLGAQVSGFALPQPDTASIFHAAQVERDVATTYGDIRDLDSCRGALRAAEPQIVFHLAAQALVRPSYDDPVGTYATNVMGTVNVLEAVRTCESVRAVVVVTSDKCYQNREWHWGYREEEPMGGFDPYSSSKGCAELVSAAYRSSYFHPDASATHSVGVATARAGNVIGGGDWAKDRLIPDFMRSILERQSLLVRSPHAIRPWQYVLEPLAGYLLLAQQLLTPGAGACEAWNFGPYDHDARPVAWLVAELTRLWGENAAWRLDAAPQPHEAHYLKLDISKARARLNWAPRWSLTQGLQKVVEWYRAQRDGHDMRAVCLAHIEAYEQAGV
jgi:CDP-glucose 4,6-dehydratase